MLCIHTEATVSWRTFPDKALVDQVIAGHAAMRDKTDAEYAAEFQALGGSAMGAPRKQEIRDIMMGLMPREQVPM